MYRGAYHVTTLFSRGSLFLNLINVQLVNLIVKCKTYIFYTLKLGHILINLIEMV